MIISRKKFNEKINNITKKIRDNRDFWKQEYDIMHDNNNFLKDLNKQIVEDRDKYKNECEKLNKRIHKLVGSCGGYSASANRANARVKELENELNILRKNIANQTTNIVIGLEDREEKKQDN